MITLYFIRQWLRCLLGTAGLGVLEWIFLGLTWLFILTGLLTLLLFAIITVLMVSDWRATRRSGVYRYDFIRDITHRR